MDKDVVILKYEQDNVKEIESDTKQLRESGESQEERLKELDDKISKLYKKSGKQPVKEKISKVIRFSKTEEIDEEPELSYDELFSLAEESLKERGLSPDELDYSGLVSQEELEDIINELNRSLPREAKWTKSDFIVVFIAAILGCIIDLILSNRDNKFTGKGSKFEKWFSKFHDHAPNAPIDFQGKGFGGGMHRGRTSGHDLLRFGEGIQQFKNGTFKGIRYVNGNPIHVIASANQYGTPYGQLSMIEAVVRYLEHMIMDFTSAASLPFPGFSFLAESKNRDFRVFAADMYSNGFNCKNIALQSLSVIIIEMIIRLYFSIQSVKEYKNKVEIAEDYSNFEAIKAFFIPANKDKLYEMLLVAHSIVTAVNVGKIAIQIVASEGTALAPALSQLNVAEIMSVVRYGAKVAGAAVKRNNENAKVNYYFDITKEDWSNIEEKMIADEKEAIFLIDETLVLTR